MASGRVKASSEAITTDNVEIDSFMTTNYLKKMAKGKLKWFGDFESLQTFVDKNLADFNGIWTTPRGGCKELKHHCFLLRWYSNTHNLILDKSKQYSR